LEVQTQEYKRLSVVSISGRIDAASAPELEEILEKQREDGFKNIVLDMAEVSFVSSSGLRVMLTARKAAKKGGGRLAIAQPSERVIDTLDISGLDVLFETFENREAAIASY
jgi:anti-anti-sigma factor